MDTIFIYNEKSDTCIRWPKDKLIPEGFIKSVRPFNEDRIQEHKNRIWYTNTITGEYKFTDKILSEEWIRGRIGTNNKEALTGKYFWITNGIECILHPVGEEIPCEWQKGRVYKNKPSGKRKSRWIWITDGITDKQFKSEEAVPEGWSYGKSISYSSRRCVFEDKEYKNIREAKDANNISDYMIKKHPSFKFI